MKLSFLFSGFIALMTIANLGAQVEAIPFSTSAATVEEETSGNETSLTPYRTVTLTTDLSKLDAKEQSVLVLLMEAAAHADRIFQMQTGSAAYEKAMMKNDTPYIQEMWRINYGPWDRLDNDRSFVEGVGPKPEGAGFYPQDMTKAEFEKWNNPEGKSPYTMVERDQKGNLKARWYHEFFSEEVTAMSTALKLAAAETNDPEFKAYLTERSIAITTDMYGASDVAWLQMKNNHLDLIIGPIENYEDKLFGLKTSYEAYVLVKDMEWSSRLARYAALLPKLQASLPGNPKVREQEVGIDSQLAAYDVVYYAGDCNSGSKTIAVNLPNDEDIQQKFGTRRSQLKNTMLAKYDHILVPIADLLIDESQRKHITFDAFFSNVMFHEVAHGLGVKRTFDGKLSVRESLKEQYSWIEEEKADVLGLWLIGQLYSMGQMKGGDMMDHYVTFLAGIFRSCRFGASSAHGNANMHTFNYLYERKAFVRDSNSGLYRVNEEYMKTGIDELAAHILELQGQGNYMMVTKEKNKAAIGDMLSRDLIKITAMKIPVDIVFEQGPKVLGLK